MSGIARIEPSLTGRMKLTTTLGLSLVEPWERKLVCASRLILLYHHHNSLSQPLLALQTVKH